MKVERLPPSIDFSDKTVILRGPVLIPREWQPVATTLRMIPVARPVQAAPSAVRLPAPSVPALVRDADATDEIDLARSRFRTGTSRWTVLAGVLVAAVIFGGMTLLGEKPNTSPAAASAPPPESIEKTLEREREMRAARAQGQWVEINDPPPVPCPAPTGGAPVAPCVPLPVAPTK